MALSTKARRRLEVAMAHQTEATEVANAVDGTTNQALVLYVNGASGHDTNPGTSALPFATIQAAIDSLPKAIRHPVTINVATGNYAGFVISGFTIDPADPTVYTNLKVLGTFVTATLGTGSATGTLTGVTAGSSTTPALAVLTDSTQSWTVNALKGLTVEILTGTGAGSMFVIASNTATALTIVSTATAPTATSATYAIRDQGTVITTYKAIKTVNSTATAPVDFATQSAGVQIFGNSAQALNIHSIWVQGIKCAPSSVNTISQGFAVSTQAAAVFLWRCRAVTAGSQGFVIGSSATVNNCSVISATSGVNGLVVTTPGSAAPQIQTSGVTMSQCLFNVTGSNAVGVSISSGAVNVTSVLFDACPFGIRYLGSGRCSTNGVFFATCGVGMQGISANNSVAFNIVNGRVSFVNCTTAIELEGPQFMTTGSVGVLVGTGNTTVISLSKGARMQLGASSTITGTTEINLDTSTADNIAAMRAATPKHLKNSNYFTVIYE